ncbi:MAG: glutaredoxin domain-containing protein [Sulfurimonadaceae bacterium]
MVRIVFLTLFSLSLSAISYPQLYSKVAGPLYEARVELDDLVYHAPLRHPVLAYQAHSDRVLGHYRLVKPDSDLRVKNEYYSALIELQKEHKELRKFLHQQLAQAIETDQYLTFLAIIDTNNEEDYKSPYLREKIYTYYNAHRQEGSSCYLDNRIKKEWESIAPYYPSKGLVNYEKTSNAFYREVTLLSTSRSPYSVKARGFLKENNVKFTEYDMEISDEGKQMFEHYKGTRVPLVIINNRAVEGYNEFEMDKLLRR